MLPQKMTVEEEQAWKLYCETTAGCMSAKDFWHELSNDEQKEYLKKVRHARVQEVMTNHGFGRKKKAFNIRGSVATLTVSGPDNPSSED